MFNLIAAAALDTLKRQEKSLLRRSDGKRNYRKGAENSLATLPRKHEREIARRLRQEARHG